PGLGCTFAEACASPAASEWHFHLPIAAGGLTGHKLAEAFATHAAPEHRAYATALLALSDEEIGGFLQGFIDRLVRHEGRWGVIDWKTNRLGPAPADYREERLLQCAMDSHYLLQAHLYLVALRRYLRQLGCDDAPAGAWLVFLRAVEPGSTHGTLHIAPPPALLDALDALFSPASA
ncbi:MAG TPA: PD-(D/E)XK nuclease family protein, partial [Opitutaceae bacterium]|nr:PD-(D/E)XK nuclease family protein [Opitutaceae bacterium]